MDGVKFDTKKINFELRKQQNEVFQKWRKKNEDLFEHAFRSMVLGVPLYLKISWNYQKDDVEVQILPSQKVESAS
jgi:hypothetical protein